jgi:hypothetical protein
VTVANAPATADTGLSCYVYGITSAGITSDALAPVEGLEGRQVRVVEHGTLAAVVEPVDPSRRLGRRRDILAHSQVLDFVAADRAVLPLRFGSVVTGPEAVIDELLGPHEDEFAAALAGLEGQVQLILKARYVEDVVLSEVVSESEEIRRLRERTRAVSEEAGYYDRVRLGELVAQAVETKREAEQERLLAALTPWAADWVVRRSAGIDSLLELAVLVDAERRDTFEQTAEDLARGMAGRATFQLVGPMAPYDFVESV